MGKEITGYRTRREGKLTSGLHMSFRPKTGCREVPLNLYVTNHQTQSV